MKKQNQRQIVMKHIADTVRDMKSLIDNPRGYWREVNPAGRLWGTPEYKFDMKCGEELERMELEIGAYLELAEKLGYVSDFGRRYSRIWDRNYKRLKKFKREVGSWWDRRD